MKEKGHEITKVAPGSIGEEMGLEPGDRLLSIGGSEIEDIFDYQFLTEDTYIELEILTKDGERCTLEIEKDEDEDLGLSFENGLMSDYRSCRNKCVFCFIDQMPPGMRETLYFKDDDSRLSFLQGNYITMTNMSLGDIERIIRYRLSPINISVHTTNPELRCQMLQNRFAGDILEKLSRLYEAGLEMNGQIVLCSGLNDTEELERTISDLARYAPHMKSLSVVPVGLTRYRDGLYPLKPVDKALAEDTIDRVERWQKKMYQKWGTHFVHCSDEFYILAERPLPEEERYDGYVQLENGVGMVRLLLEEVKEGLKTVTGDTKKREVSMATGRLAYPYIQQVVSMIQDKFPALKAYIYPIRNDFFGELITVSGLLTGRDLTAQLKGKPLGERLLLPVNMLKNGEDVFLDDVTVSQVEKALQVPVNIVKSSGNDLIGALLGKGEDGGRETKETSRYSERLSGPYELKEL